MRADVTLGLKFRNILRAFQGAGSTLCPADSEDVSNVRQPRHFSVRPRAMWQRRFCTPLERGGRRACFRPPCFWRRQTSSALSVAGFDSLAVVASVRDCASSFAPLARTKTPHRSCVISPISECRVGTAQFPAPKIAPCALKYSPASEHHAGAFSILSRQTSFSRQTSVPNRIIVRPEIARTSVLKIPSLNRANLNFRRRALFNPIRKKPRFLGAFRF